MLALGASAAALLLLWPQPSMDAQVTADVWQPPALIREPEAGASAEASAERERGVALLVLRAELLTMRGDCVAAVEAARKARDAGAHPSRLARVAACRDPQQPR